MPSIHEQLQQFPRGGILYDASLPGKPTAEWFTRDYWAARNSVSELRGGRGSVCFIDTGQGRWVLRHYHRGGLIANISRDRYVWLGADRTRCFAEWRLLAELRRRDLPVPRPVAARYVRGLLTYRADLITEELPPSRTLAQALEQGVSTDRWRAVGSTIARFHCHGVHHADLNAHNILLGDDGVVYLLDFDRGRIEARGSWEQQVLARLQRSLIKVSQQRPPAAFGEGQWLELMRGYGDAVGG